jgi:hypothetical protein
VATPHKGADLADFLDANVENGSFTETVVGYFANSLATVIGICSARLRLRPTPTWRWSRSFNRRSCGR